MAAAPAVKGLTLSLRFEHCKRRWWRLPAIALSAALVAWVAGLVWFITLASRPAPPPPPVTDGIVALTGGAGRIEAALHLLAKGRAGVLLVSGMGSSVDLATLAHRAGLDPEPLVERVTLGRNAASTRGNAKETAAWAERNRIRTLVVVTASYHMPRALIELGRAMPGVRLFPWPVMLVASDTKSPPTLRLLIEEYNKYIAVVSGLSALLPSREPVREIGRTPARNGSRA
jgi:uncharacterized SAM-binding protein YcdF (DUF218 family)